MNSGAAIQQDDIRDEFGKVKAGDIQIKVREDKVSLSYQIGEVVGGAWGETLEEALQNLAQTKDKEIRPDADDNRYIVEDETFAECPNCGGFTSADHHDWIADQVVRCEVDVDG